MRRLSDVIDRIIPFLTSKDNKVKNRLEDIKQSVAFAAPEMIGYWWAEAQDCLIRGIKPTHENYHKILRIWNAKE